MVFVCSVINFRLIFIAVLFQLIICTQGAEILSISKDQIKQVRDEVEFNCTVDNSKNNTLLWMKISNNPEPITLSTNKIMLIRNERFFVNYNESTSTYSLKITNLEPNDAGFYQCQIALDVNSQVTKKVKLDIKRPPQIINIPHKSITVTEGETVNLECHADGYPLPYITWKREDNEILPLGGNLHRGNSLKISNISRFDRGIYYCIAENDVKPSAQAPIKVNVEFAPMIYAERPKIGQALDYPIDLKCHIEAYPMPNMTWLKNDQVIAKETPEVSNDKFLYMHHIDRIKSDDYGYYTCRAQNKYGVAKAVIEVFKANMPWIY